MRLMFSTLAIAGLIAIAGSGSAFAGPIELNGPIALNITDHKFTPGEYSVPANQKFQVKITNHDDTPAEFESHDLKIEKIIVAGGTITISVGPLKPGTYKFVDDYNPDDANGVFIARE